VLVGYDDDLAGQATRISNRIRGLLTGIYPALERPGAEDHPPGGAGDPVPLRRTSLASARPGDARSPRSPPHAPRISEKLITAIWAALDEQTVTVADTAAADRVLPRLAESLKTVLAQRTDPRWRGRKDPRCAPSCPGPDIPAPASGSGPPPASCSRSTTPGVSPAPHTWLPTPASLRSPTAPAPLSRGEHPAHAGNRKLKRAFFLAAFPALSDPVSRACYDRKLAEGKTQRRPHLPGPTPLRHPVRHAPLVGWNGYSSVDFRNQFIYHANFGHASIKLGTEVMKGSSRPPSLPVSPSTPYA
jgi:hypothetical protein